MATRESVPVPAFSLSTVVESTSDAIDEAKSVLAYYPGAEITLALRKLQEAKHWLQEVPVEE